MIRTTDDMKAALFVRVSEITLEGRGGTCTARRAGCQVASLSGQAWIRVEYVDREVPKVEELECRIEELKQQVMKQSAVISRLIR
jgi:hypothetical protein